MSLIRKVADLVRERGTATAPDLAPFCPEASMEQVMQAMQNARHKGWLVVLDRRQKGRFGGRLPHVYGPGEPPPPKPLFRGKRPPASVWELGTI